MDSLAYRRWICLWRRDNDVCQEWEDFSKFQADMGEPQLDHSTLDRKDPSKPFEPGNCFWTTLEDRMSRSRHLRYLEVNNERHCLAGWARKLGVTRQAIFDRLKKGKSLEDVVSAKAKERGRLVIRVGKEDQAIADLARKHGINYPALSQRLRAGWPMEEALKKTVRATKRKSE